ncbi:MAG: 2-oxo acid dehydrogenase subunit E2 [Lentisphaerae bacterium]|nr:2-oxo acid dehydrogenase subunit E2 [Lentisphaerota bacterium]
MKTVDVRMPQMGQSAAEGTIVKWHKKMGDRVHVDEVLVEVESDKINVEVECPVAGRLIGSIKEGRTVPVGDVIAMIETDNDGAGDAPASSTPPAAGSRPHMNSSDDQELVSTDTMPNSLDAPALPDSTRDWLSPGVMRLALLNNITVAELKLINGSGRNNRITRDDVLNLIARRDGTASVGRRAEPSTTVADTVVPMTSIRKTIADHMVQSVRTSAHVTMVHAADMTHIVQLRNRIKDAFFNQHGVRMSYTAVVTYVVSRVLREFPTINASVVGTNIVLRNEVNVGCAVALPDESLVVPVVRNADRKTFPEISRELDRLIGLARNKALGPSDVHGGTFTLSNFGAFGSLIGTPLINQPQVAILGMGAVFQAPVVINGDICVRDITYLSFSFDHRVIDGAMGGRFLNRLQKSIEALNESILDVAELT